MQRKSEKGQWRVWENKKKWEWRKGEEKEIKWKLNNTLEYLKEGNERIDELRKQELELKKQALQQEERKNKKKDEVDEPAAATATNWGFPDHDDDHVFKVFGEELLNYGVYVYFKHIAWLVHNNDIRHCHLYGISYRIQNMVTACLETLPMVI